VLLDTTYLTIDLQLSPTMLPNKRKRLSDLERHKVCVKRQDPRYAKMTYEEFGALFPRPDSRPMASSVISFLSCCCVLVLLLHSCLVVIFLSCCCVPVLLGYYAVVTLPL